VAVRGCSLEAFGAERAVAIGYALANGRSRRSVHSFEMASLLRRFLDLDPGISTQRLAEQLVQCASAMDGFAVDGPFVKETRRGISERAIVLMLEELRASEARDAEPAASAQTAREPGSRPQRTEIDVPSLEREPALSAAAPASQRAEPKVRPQRSPRESRRAQRAPASRPDGRNSGLAPRAIAAAQSVLPPAPPPASIEVVLQRDSLGAWNEAALEARGSLTGVSLALRGRLIAQASAFQDLLGIASLRGVESFPYQLETVRRVLRVLRGRALLADEVGLGKTIEALMVLREYQLRGMVRRALVLAPPALTRHWRGELEAKAGIEVRSTDDAAFRADPEAFWRGDGVAVASLALARGARHASSVRAAPWDLVIVDEAHHLKNRATLAYRLVSSIESRFLLLLTATPVETDLEEIFNLVTLLAPGQLTTPAAFRQQFVDPKDPTRPKDTERLRRLLGEVMVRNTRAQSGLALPPRYVETLAVEPSREEREAYDGVVALLREHAQDGRARLAATALLLEAGSSPAALRATLDKIAASDAHAAALRAGAAAIAERIRDVSRCRKLEALLQLVRASGEQVLIFTRYRHTADYIAAGVRELGIKVETFHGAMPSAERAAAVERFRAGARVMVATDVGGEGQNLQFCQTLVNFDLPWNPAQIEQRIGRLHRMGQTGEVRVFNLCAKGTVEDRVLDVLDRRLHLFELVVGELDMVIGNLSDERDLEERILALYAESKSESEIDTGFDRIADELARARGHYERSRALDEALFRRDFET
jgi:superfamily II DNA or RNA helicase